jgi:hypothetical protein
LKLNRLYESMTLHVSYHDNCIAKNVADLESERERDETNDDLKDERVAMNNDKGRRFIGS